MIRAHFTLDSNRRITDFTITGHAEAGPYGQDIVCAGVSAIMQTTLLGLEAIADSYPQNVHIDYK